MIVKVVKSNSDMLETKLQDAFDNSPADSYYYDMKTHLNPNNGLIVCVILFSEIPVNV